MEPRELQPEAERQVDALRSFYEGKGRTEASRDLDRALDEAERRIEAAPGEGLPAQRLDSRIDGYDPALGAPRPGQQPAVSASPRSCVPASPSLCI